MVNKDTNPDVDFSKVQALGNRLLEKLSAMRDVDPIIWSPTQNAWIVTGHQEVAEGFKGNLPLSVDRFKQVLAAIDESEQVARIPITLRTLPKFLITLDPPEQLRLRKLMMRAFSKKVAESYRPYVRQLVGAVIQRATAKQEIDVVSEIAREISGRLILRLMGLSKDYYEKLPGWTLALSSGLQGGGTRPEMLDACEAALGEMEAAFKSEIAQRRAAPTDDFISALIEAEEEGQRLTDAEILATCHLALIAGHETTANTITLVTAALASHSNLLAELKVEPEEATDIAMELMRHVAMSTCMVRTATEDFEWSGHKIREGQVIYLMIAGANRDPSAFPNPEEIDFSRNQGKNMVFAPGLHHCVGHHLAKLQLSEYLSELGKRVSRIELRDSELHWSTTLTFRGLQQLNVCFHPLADESL